MGKGQGKREKGVVKTSTINTYVEYTVKTVDGDIVNSAKESLTINRQRCENVTPAMIRKIKNLGEGNIIIVDSVDFIEVQYKMPRMEFIEYCVENGYVYLRSDYDAEFSETEKPEIYESLQTTTTPDKVSKTSKKKK